MLSNKVDISCSLILLKLYVNHCLHSAKTKKGILGWAKKKLQWFQNKS